MREIFKHGLKYIVPNEIWRDVVGYEKLYQVSDLGNVRSYDKLVDYKFGRIYTKKGRKLKGGLGSHGYLTVALCDSRQTSICIHRLVAEAFVDNDKNFKCINHKNGIKTDNRAENLEWVNHSKNNKHAYDTGLKKPFRKLTTVQVNDIRYNCKHKLFTHSRLAKIYEVSRPTITQIANFKSRLNG